MPRFHYVAQAQCTIGGWHKAQPLPGHLRQCWLLRPRVGPNVVRDALALSPHPVLVHTRSSTATLKHFLVATLTKVPPLPGQVTNVPNNLGLISLSWQPQEGRRVTQRGCQGEMVTVSEANILHVLATHEVDILISICR